MPDPNNDDERRDAVLRRMLTTPKPAKAAPKAKPQIKRSASPGGAPKRGKPTA